MTLAPHVRLGPYEVLDRIGAGGMGEVYRARDTRLEREVAIKVLPDSFASDEDRLRRFEREARVLASLNHPNVAQIFGLDRHGDTLYLVLELVAGADLAERVARGPLPLDEALDVCRQIATGLEAAHEAGIVHRDLKPANVRITPQGAVKVLDFGLAKPLKTGADSAMLTETGLVLGTPTYMSPEQVRGKHVDRRTDLWALGCVLFECLSGRRAFDGATTGDVLSSVLTGEPDWSLLPTSTSARATELVRRCLEKDPLRRLRDAGDARIELEEALARRERAATGRATAAASPARSGLVVGLALAGAAMLLLGWLAGRWIAPRDSAAVAADPRPFHLSAILSAESRFSGLVAIAPDASYFVYSSLPPGHVDGDLPRGWLTTRWLDRDETRIIEGTEGANSAALSPDGRWLAFLALSEGRGIESMSLKKVAFEDGRAIGPPILLCPNIGAWAYLSYASDQEIVLTTSAPDGRFLAVPAQGGTPRVVVHETEEDRNSTQRWGVTQGLPGGGWVLANRLGIRDGQIVRDVEAVDLVTGERKLVLERATAPQYAPTGHLLAVRDGALVAVPFDVARLEPTGEAVAIRDVREAVPGLPYSFSETGVLAVVRRTGGGRGRIGWIEPQGRAESLDGASLPFFFVRIARDGRRVAYGTWEPDQPTPPGEFWVQDLERRTTVRHPIAELTVFDAIWDPTGETLTYGEGFDKNLVIRERRADGAGEPTRLYSHPTQGGVVVPLAWKRDGSTLAFAHREPGRDEFEIWMLQRNGGGAQSEATRYLTAQGFAQEATFSPDGNWFCFTANDAGRQEIFVQRFGGVGAGEEDAQAGRWKISTDGGRSPWWSSDGREIRYVDSRDQLVSVPVDAGSSFSVGEATRLIDLKALGVRGAPTFTEDGRMLVALADDESEEVTRIDVVVNWFEELKAKAPAPSR